MLQCAQGNATERTVSMLIHPCIACFARKSEYVDRRHSQNTWTRYNFGGVASLLLPEERGGFTGAPCKALLWWNDRGGPSSHLKHQGGPVTSKEIVRVLTISESAKTWSVSALGSI